MIRLLAIAAVSSLAFVSQLAADDERKGDDPFSMRISFHKIEPAKVRQFGHLAPNHSEERLIIRQVVDDSTVLATWKFAAAWINGSFDGVRGEVEFAITGYPTKGSIDGQVAAFPKSAIFEKSDTYSYVTALGAKRTIIAVRYVPPDELAKRMTEAAQQKRKAEMRTFSDAAGKFTVVARFVEVKSNKAVLEKEDGSKIGVELKRLSADDQKWIREESKRRRESRKTRASGL
jgi:hypothetical protein